MNGVYTNIEELAHAVKTHDALCAAVSEESIGHVLEIALVLRIGKAALDGHHVVIDLGNGHVLHCTTKKIVGAVHL
jgi:uncharacterized protein YsxB (DUF464 family)